MVSVDFAKAFALSLNNVIESTHFEKISFKTKNKIFLTINPPFNRACVKISLIDQNVFCSFNSEIIYPVPNKWGKNGWTLINLKKIRKDMFKDIVKTSFNTVTNKNVLINQIND